MCQSTSATSAGSETRNEDQASISNPLKACKRNFSQAQGQSKYTLHDPETLKTYDDRDPFVVPKMPVDRTAEMWEGTTNRGPKHFARVNEHLEGYLPTFLIKSHRCQL